MAIELSCKNKVALITGVTSGIGASIATMFAKAEAIVVGCGRHDENADEAKQFLVNVQNNGTKALYVKADVTIEEDLKQLVEKAVAAFGPIDIVVSNAGLNIFEGAENCTEEEWQKNINLNLSSHWHFAKLCKPYLEENNGVIIIMTSNHAYSSIPGCFPYNVTKTALTGLVRSLAIEWGPKIRTVGIAPGFIDTPGNQKWFDSFADAGKERQRTIDLHPVKRIGTPEEVGAWCVFLASEYAAFASGTTYLLDGGRNALMQDE